jgi:hypothetical protein
LVVGKVYRTIGRIIGYGAAVLALFVAAVGVRLMFGPIKLDFLRSQVAQEFDTPAGRLQIGADHIYIEWAGVELPMRLVFNGLRVTNDDKQTIALAPSIALSFQPRSVFKARFLPTAIVVERPTLDADIAREGGMLQRVFAKTDSGSQGEVVDLLIQQLLAEPNYTTLLGQLDTVLVEHGHVSFRDVPSGVTWVAPDVRAQLKRDDSGVIISAAGYFSNGGSPVDVAMSGVYARDRSRVSIETRIDGLKPPMLAGLSSDAAILRGVDVTLGGRMRIEASGKGDVRMVSIDVRGGPGTVSLPGILPVAHGVRSLSAAASVDAASHTAKIDHISFDLGSATVSVTGTGTRTEQGQNFAGRAEVHRIPADRLGDYWPLAFANGGREWALANLSRGTIDIAAEFAVSAPGDDMSALKVDRSVALLDYRDLTVHYMPHMPELTGVTGTARYQNNALHFDIARGAGAGLTVTGATIDLTDLDKQSTQTATLHVPISGSAGSVLALLARPKLGLSRDVLYDPKRVGGNAAIDLTLSFPLLNSLTVADLDIKADAALSHLSIKDVLGAVDLTEATAHAVYGDQHFAVTGSGKLDGSPVEIAWREQFGPKVSYRRRYELKGTVPAAAVAKAGFPSPEPFVTGPVNISSLSYQVAASGTAEMQGRFDIKGAKASIPQLGWTKEAGSDGSLALSLKLGTGAKLASAEFEGRGGGLAAKGTVRFGEDSTVQQMTLGQFTLGRNDLSMDWKRRGGGVDVDLRGRSLELAKVRQVLKARDEDAKATPGGAAEKSRASTRVTANLSQVLVQRGTLGAFTGRLEMVGDRLASADLGLAAGKGSTFRVQPAAGGRNVVFYVADFGLLLRDAGWMDGLSSSFLSLNGRFDDSTADAPLIGTLKLGPFRLEKVTTPRHDVDTLNSAIDGLNRAGNAQQQFDGLEAGVVKTGDRVDVRNGRTNGKSIGLTTAGTLDLATDTARLHGVVVPGFALNNFLSNVPLLGTLLTGGKDEGVFAISYKLEGPFDDLKSDVNMMSAVTPGVLRDLFKGSSDSNAQPPQPSSP